MREDVKVDASGMLRDRVAGRESNEVAVWNLL